MNCPKCDTPNQPGSNFCANCGSPLTLKDQTFYQRHKRFIKFFAVFLVLFFIYNSISSFFREFAEELGRQSEEESIISGQGEDKIALINIDGIIIENDPPGGIGGLTETYTSARRIKKTLRDIKKDETVKGVVLRINSPGGSAAASEEILSDINEFKRQTNIPIVAYFSDMAASGGYYVAMGSDKIVANPSSITGNIGVLISYLNVEKLAENYGVENIVFKSGPHKDIISSFRAPSAEENQILENLVRDSFENFLEAVSTGRDMEKNKLRPLADGRIYSAVNAQDNGLIDQIGHLEDAAAAAKTMAKLEDATFVEFGRKTFVESLLSSISIRINMASFSDNLLSPFLSKPGARIMYLYNP
jgi:protease IV